MASIRPHTLHSRLWILSGTCLLLLAVTHLRADPPQPRPELVAAMANLLNPVDEKAFSQAQEDIRAMPDSVVEELSALLASPDAQLRLGALCALREVGLAARGTARRLCEISLSDPDAEVRLSALITLADFGWTDAATIVPRLPEGFDKKSEREQYRVVATVGELGRHSVEHVPWLIRLARNPAVPASVRQSTVFALSRIAADLPPDSRPIKEVASALFELAEQKPLGQYPIWGLFNLSRVHAIDLAPLLRLLQTSRDVELLCTCLEIARHHPDFARQALPTILALGRAADRARTLGSRSALRSQVVWLLGGIQAPDEQSLDFLLTCLNDPDANVVRQAVTALGECGPAASVAIGRLIIRARRPAKPDARLQDQALEALVRIAPADPRVLDTLSKGLRDSSSLDREATLLVIANHRLKNSSLLKEALTLLNDQQPELRALASRVCIQNGEITPQVLTVIRRIATGDTKSVPPCRFAIEAAAAGIPRSEECRSLLRDILEKGTIDTRDFALKAFERSSAPLDPASLQAIKLHLDDPKSAFQARAAALLLKHNLDDSHARDLLVRRTLRGNYSTSLSALQAIAAAPSLPANVVAQLKFLEDSPERERRKLFQKLAARAAK